MEVQKVTTAGVRTTRSGPLVFVDASGFAVEPGDDVTVQMDGDAGNCEAHVVIAPQQFVERPPVSPTGRVVEVRRR